MLYFSMCLNSVGVESGSGEVLSGVHTIPRLLVCSSSGVSVEAAVVLSVGRDTVAPWGSLWSGRMVSGGCLLCTVT